MDLAYEDTQLILRALEGHCVRMAKIAEAESMLGRYKEANVAAEESKRARRIADMFKSSGVSMS